MRFYRMQHARYIAKTLAGAEFSQQKDNPSLETLIQRIEESNRERVNKWHKRPLTYVIYLETTSEHFDNETEFARGTHVMTSSETTTEIHMVIDPTK